MYQQTGQPRRNEKKILRNLQPRLNQEKVENMNRSITSDHMESVIKNLPMKKKSMTRWLHW